MTNSITADQTAADSTTTFVNTDAESSDISPIRGKRIVFLGKLGGLSRRDAVRLIREHDAIACDSATVTVDIVVIGAEESPLSQDDLLSPEIREASAGGQVEILSETEFWQRLGLVEAEQAVKRLYTPAMLADLLGVSVRVIRRWHRRGLIVPARTVHQLPYFEFQEIATARRLAELLAAGASVEAIERKLASLTQVLPNVDRPLAQLSVIVEGKQLLLRQGEGLIEPGGQLRIDFDSLPFDDSKDEQFSPSVIAFEKPLEAEAEAAKSASNDSIASDLLLQQAFDLEDEGNFEAAIDCYHAILARDGARRPISAFNLLSSFIGWGRTGPRANVT
ncbi:MAG: MerR family transcriptional regulator [Pirellulaceae bacterium]